MCRAHFSQTLFQKPKNEIYLGNSGTSARLLTGLLATQPFNTTIEGDKSLSLSPMERIINPLIQMGLKLLRIQSLLKS